MDNSPSSVFSPAADSWASPENSASSIGSDALDSSRASADPAHRECKLACGQRSVRLDEKVPHTAVKAWDRIRQDLAVAPFQTLVQPTCEDRWFTTLILQRESPLKDNGVDRNPFRDVGTLGQRFDPTEPQFYVRTRHFAPTLGRFLPRDPQ